MDGDADSVADEGPRRPGLYLHDSNSRSTVFEDVEMAQDEVRGHPINCLAGT